MVASLSSTGQTNAQSTIATSTSTRMVLSGYLTFENLGGAGSSGTASSSSSSLGQREVRAYLDELEFICPRYVY